MTHTDAKTVPTKIGRLAPWLIAGVPLVVTLLMTLYPGWNPMVVDELKVWLNEDNAAEVVLVVFGCLISACWIALVGWYKSAADLREARRQPDPDDQTKFTIVLKRLTDSTGLFGWLMNGRFSGSQWRSKDLDNIHEFLGPPYKSIEFRDADVQTAYRNLHAVLNTFIAELGQHAGQSTELLDADGYPNGESQTYLNNRGTAEAEQIAEHLSKIADAAIDARTSFLQAGRRGKLSDTVLIESVV